MILAYRRLYNQSSFRRGSSGTWRSSADVPETLRSGAIEIVKSENVKCQSPCPLRLALRAPGRKTSTAGRSNYPVGRGDNTSKWYGEENDSWVPLVILRINAILTVQNVTALGYNGNLDLRFRFFEQFNRTRH